MSRPRHWQVSAADLGEVRHFEWRRLAPYARSTFSAGCVDAEARSAKVTYKSSYSEVARWQILAASLPSITSAFPEQCGNVHWAGTNVASRGMRRAKHVWRSGCHTARIALLGHAFANEARKPCLARHDRHGAVLRSRATHAGAGCANRAGRLSGRCRGRPLGRGSGAIRLLGRVRRALAWRRECAG